MFRWLGASGRSADSTATCDRAAGGAEAGGGHVGDREAHCFIALGADLQRTAVGTVEKLDVVETGCIDNAVDLGLQLLYFRVEVGAVGQL